ncbi:DUF2802 domain-containing protein [Agarivorans aestuarii]|jgi:hypothetical protein|uniref:DUF2802 domain-containing protein n=1 Tax=Agarivorans aestuarii TaxID=1563703 RepID=A0ABU7G1F2_9ALTE|nr:MULTISPECIES: DUF2802 domain-containing protein [Agarivorans]MEE1672784.1 DUF2802 domain-containing protein [Agarivorans aestuarii]
MDWINLIALVATVVCLVGAIWFSNKAQQQVKANEQKMQSLEVVTKNLLQSHRVVEKQLQEIHQANASLVGELERQSEQVEQAFLRTSQIQSQDPDSKLYTRAVKLVELGADLDEVMRECELPKAEAELLLSLRNKMKGQVS